MSEDMTAEDVCQKCGAPLDEHDYQQLARECYPTQIDHYRSLLREAREKLKCHECDLIEAGWGEEAVEVRALLSRINDALGEG